MDRRTGLNRLMYMALRPYWRMRRGLTMGAQGVVIDGAGGVLLVRHGYRPGWHFPGGGVEWGEATVTAMGREVMEETGVVVTVPPVLHGIFTNFARFPGDHVVVFVVRGWERPTIPAPSSEIAEARFFPVDGLPVDLAPGARNRIGEIFEGRPLAREW